MSATESNQIADAIEEVELLATLRAAFVLLVERARRAEARGDLVEAARAERVSEIKRRGKIRCPQNLKNKESFMSDNNGFHPLTLTVESDVLLNTDTDGHAKKGIKRVRKKKIESPILVEVTKAPIPEVEERIVHPKNKLNDLTAKEWIPETVSVWNQRGLGANHPDAQIERQHPAPFSFTDVSRLVRLFTKADELILDPFVGVGSTLKACAVEGRRGIGFELNSRYAELSRLRVEKEVRTLIPVPQQIVLNGDARQLIKELDENSVDFIVTSPPYWNILHKEDHKAKQERISNELDTRYSDDPRDLGNIHDYDEFLRELASILGGCVTALKPKKYMAVIVSDFRDKSRFVMFHAHLAESLEAFGLELRGIKVLYQRHKRIFPYGYPYAYVPNIHHQYILILQNTKK